MAELHVQRKDTNIWPWIIGAVLLAAVLWFVFLRADTRNVTSTNATDSTYQTQPAPGTMTPNTP